MSPPAGPRGPLPGRVLGLYALATMDREGPVHGYLLANRIAERTLGAWRPGAGAIYPALASITERGLARSLRRGRRREYTITPRGRRFLAELRRNWGSSTRQGPDLSRLWMEIAGSNDLGQHLMARLRRSLEGLTAQLDSDAATLAGKTLLRDQALAELDVARSRILAAGTDSPRTARRRSS
jgi:DNA-binding PadR family transcriptional regulator